MWYTKFGPSGDVVLSSRVRLARNIDGIPFGAKMSAEDRSAIIKTCKTALSDLKYIDLSAMTDIEKASLREEHLISPEIAESKNNCGILVNSDCTVCVMLGEEDHIRIQAMSPGFNLFDCLRRANETDDRLEEHANLAYDAKFGYLTACPTNTGTGLRASVMVHLPALTETKSITGIVRSLSKLGLTVRGIYGEGSEALGNIYQISNQVTLGVTEEETIEKLEQIITELIEKEKNAGIEIYKNNKFVLEDRIYRAKGILTNARLITSSEAMQRLSDVRWGITLGIISDINHEQLSCALYKTLPASLAKAYNLVSATERDLKRAEVLREMLAAN